MGQLFQYKDWGYSSSSQDAIGEGSIKILYREQVKVFYKDVQQAKEHNY